MVTADLHVHTTNSDGTMTLDEVPAAARRAGVGVVAVTDHDRLHPDLSHPWERRDDVLLVHGIELRVEAGDQRVDLLGYAAERTRGLQREIARLQRDRVERGRTIVECIERRMEVELDLELVPGIGRPHIARATAEATGLEYGEVFDELISDDGPCYVARSVPTFDRGRELLAEACGLVGLAHPLRYPDPEAALGRCGALDAVEQSYPYDRTVNDAPVVAALERHGLVPTGGSDAHDDELGRAGLAGADVDRFLAAAGVPDP